MELGKIANGDVQRLFDREYEKVLKNIMDPQTSATKKRVINLKITVEPGELRNNGTIQVEVSSKLAPQLGVSSVVSIGRDEDTGQIKSNEWGRELPGQTYIGEDGSLKTEDGETIDENGNVMEVVK